MQLKPMKVKCLNGHAGAGLEEGHEYEVAVVVRDWTDHRGPQTGEAYILSVRGEPSWPYCWDATRFEVVQQAQYD